jgi:alpha-acetolactate decarboxylase
MGKSQPGTGGQGRGELTGCWAPLYVTLSLHSGFHGDFISSKLLIKFHIYDQKIKSLGLSEIGFYEFGLRQLSQQGRAWAV